MLAAQGRPGGIDGHVSGPRAKDAVNGRDGLEALGQPQAHPVATARAPARQAGRQTIGTVQERRKRQRPAVLIKHGRVIGPPRGSLVKQSAQVESIHGQRPVTVRLDSQSRGKEWGLATAPSVAILTPARILTSALQGQARRMGVKTVLPMSWLLVRASGNSKR